MANFQFHPEGVCSQLIRFSIDDEGKLHNVEFMGGCSGNLRAIGKLVEGKDASSIASVLSGNCCGPRPTSCADQFSRAVLSALKRIDEKKAQKGASNASAEK